MAVDSSPIGNFVRILKTRSSASPNALISRPKYTRSLTNDVIVHPIAYGKRKTFLFGMQLSQDCKDSRQSYQLSKSRLSEHVGPKRTRATVGQHEIVSTRQDNNTSILISATVDVHSSSSTISQGRKSKAEWGTLGRKASSGEKLTITHIAIQCM